MEISNELNYKKSELYFLLTFLAGVFLLTFFIFKPFLYIIVLAIIFATVFEPLHKKMLFLTRNVNFLASFLSTIFVFFIVITPVVFLSVQIFYEATDVYSYIFTNENTIDFSHKINELIQNFSRFSPVPIDSLDINQYLKQGLSWVLQHFGLLLNNFTKGILSTFIFLISLFYLFKDGGKLKKTFINLSPLKDVHDEIILDRIALAINSVVKGSLVVAIVQGVLTTIGFLIFGVPNAILWGSVTVIAALVPGLGTALVFIPAIIYLFLLGEIFATIGLLFWGLAAVGLIDNFLGPMLIERKIKSHPFLILLSVLGGISFFGPLGFLFGPLVLNLLIVLVEVYYDISKK